MLTFTLLSLLSLLIRPKRILNLLLYNADSLLRRDARLPFASPWSVRERLEACMRAFRGHHRSAICYLLGALMR